MNSDYLDPPRCPWHDGEVAAQNRAGKFSQQPVIRTHMTEQLRDFFPQLSSIFAGALDPEGYPRAGVLVDMPGFISAPGPDRLQINSGMSLAEELGCDLHSAAPIGLLGLDFGTRRRNRVNGIVTQVQQGRVEIMVTQAFGNCPKYITKRELPVAFGSASGNWCNMSGLDARAARMITSADTFFVASSAPSLLPSGGVDISHRGGVPGFVNITEQGQLTIPDYAGNNYFNTLGNILLQPKCSLLFLDFQTGERLQLCGLASVDWSHAQPSAPFETPRRWVFTPAYRRRALPHQKCY